MGLLKQRILDEGKVLPGNILKVGSFLNHQIDTELVFEMGKEIVRVFGHKNITRVLTVESSGIPIAFMAAHFLKVPMVFAKKSKSKNISEDVYSVEVPSFTHKNVNTVIVSKNYITKDDNVLLVDDFLANGCALLGLNELVKQAGATTAGAAVAIEKGFQDGGKKVREAGIDLHSLAIIARMDDEHVYFAD